MFARLFHKQFLALRKNVVANDVAGARATLALAGARRDIDRRDADGATVLCLAAMNGSAEMVALLLGHGASVDRATKTDGFSPLVWCCLQDRVDAARVLLEHGADVSLRIGDDHITPLHAAAAAGNHELCRMLSLHEMVQIDAVDDSGMTPLMCAATAGVTRAAVTLIECGAQICVSGQSALDAARRGLQAATLAKMFQAAVAQEDAYFLPAEDGRHCLSTLDMSGLAFGDDDDVLVALIGGIRLSREVDMLLLGGTLIGDGGLEKLADAIICSASVSAIDLRQNRLTSRGEETVLRIARDNKRITEIVLDDDHPMPNADDQVTAATATREAIVAQLKRNAARSGALSVYFAVRALGAGEREAEITLPDKHMIAIYMDESEQADVGTIAVLRQHDLFHDRLAMLVGEYCCGS